MIKECCGYMKSFSVRYLVSVVLIYLVDIADAQSYYSAAYQPLASGYGYGGGYVNPDTLQKVHNGIYSFANDYTLPTTTPRIFQWFASTAPPTVKPEKSKWYKDPNEVSLTDTSDFDLNTKDEWGFLDPPPLVTPPALSTPPFMSKKMAKWMMKGVKIAIMILLGLGLPTVFAFNLLVFAKLLLGFKVAVLGSGVTLALLALKYYLHHKHKLRTYLTAIETVQTVADVATASGLPFWGPALITSGASAAAGLTGAAALFAIIFGNSTNSTTTTTTAAPDVVNDARNRIELLHLPLPDEVEPEQRMESEVYEEPEQRKPPKSNSVTGKIMKTTKDLLHRWKKYLIIS